MLDINGAKLEVGALAQLLCEIVSIDEEGIRVRIMNSSEELLVGIKHDEVLGGDVADSELVAFEAPPARAIDIDGVRQCQME